VTLAVVAGTVAQGDGRDGSVDRDPVPAEAPEVRFPVFRDAESEARFQAERTPTRAPSPEGERAALDRARTAARNRDPVALAVAARDLVVHAPAGVAAGWTRAARAWLDLYRSAHAFSEDWNHHWEERSKARRAARDALEESAHGFYAAYRTSSDPDAAAKALGDFSDVELIREEYARAEFALQAVVKAGGGPETGERLERIRHEHGFRILQVGIDNDRADPRACLALSAEVAGRQRANVADYVSVEPSRGDHPVRLRESTLCLGNLEHGAEYALTLREGLTDVHGRTVVPGERRVFVPDRPARAKFSSGRYVLPMTGPARVPVTTVNRDGVPLELLRITDGRLVDEVLRGRLGRDLDGYELDRVVGWLGERLWRGSVSVRSARNREVVTAIPIDDLMPSERRPGVYLLAESFDRSERARYENRAVQWLVISDIGLSTVRGAGGLSVFARSLATAGPMAGVRLVLQARNEDTLAEAVTDGDGHATFAPGLLRGAGGREAVLLKASSVEGGHTFLSLTGPAFDLADRGAGGRPVPGPVNAHVYTDRGIYRPGETVHLNALVRDDRGRALADLPLDLTVVRPDGVVARTLSVLSDETGAVPFDYVLVGSAVTGDWRFELRVPGDGATVGETAVQVNDFVPPRVEVSAEAPDAFRAGAVAPLTLSARFFHGGPGADLAVTGRVRVEADPEPFAAWSGYRFGLADAEVVPARADLPDARTGEDGTAALSVALPRVPESTHPLRARIEAALLERGGRPVGVVVVRAVRDSRERVGIRSRFAGSVGPGAPAVFDVVLVDGAGEAVGGRALEWRLYREERDLFWYRRPGGHWEYREITSDRTVDSGGIRTSVLRAEPARIALQAEWGDYRLEVRDPGAPGALPASTRFRVGWGGNDPGPGAPDMMTVRLDRDRYRPGDAADVRLEAPFDGIALVTVLTDRVERVHSVEVVEGTADLTLPVEEWTAGAHVAATVFRPASLKSEHGPARAVGLAWLAVDQPERRLVVAFDPPVTAASGAAVPVAFRVTNGAGIPVPARLTLAAVDEGILRMTGFRSPDPVAMVFGRRRLGVDLRDLYGRLIDARRGRPGTVRSGGDEAHRLLGGIQPPRETVALFHGLIRTDAQGRGEVVLDIPEGFNGRLRLMAVAHTKESVGHGLHELVVRDPLTADLYLPRFLAPGDEAQVTVELANHDAPAGEYAPALSVTGPAGIAGTLPRAVHLAPGERRSMPVTLWAGAPGDARLTLEAFGPNGIRVERMWTLAVRPAQAWRRTRRSLTLEPGVGITLSEDLIAGLHEGDARVSVSLSAVPYDLHGLIASLDRYPYGCTEQIVSRALPWLHVRALRPEAGGRDVDPDLRDRVREAARRVLAHQRPDGGFGLWGPGDGADPWVSAYALDFLDQAHRQGFEVDAAALHRSRLYIVNLLNQPRTSGAETEAAAYGLAVLARSGAVEPGTVRHFVNARLDRVESGLGRAQVALAAGTFGLVDEAEAALAAAVPAVGGGRYATYGSELRDAAALVVAAATLDSDALREAAARLRRLAVVDAFTSTQEKAWMVVAARELNRAMERTRLTVDGTPARIGPGGFHQVVGAADLEGDGLTVTNRGDRPVDLVIGVGGHPVAEEPASADGITMTRTFLTREGLPAETSGVRQGDELTVVLEGRLAASRHPRRLLVADLLPAGVEIQAALTEGEGHRVLGPLDQPTALRLRDDRYVAALTSQGGDRFRLAYRVRAVTTGSFRVPAAYVEDMYDVSTHARGTMGRLSIRPRRPPAATAGG